MNESIVMLVLVSSIHYLNLYDNCQCFSHVSFGMKTNSGKYKIKCKINNISNQSTANGIGISCNAHETSNSQGLTS